MSWVWDAAALAGLGCLCLGLWRVEPGIALVVLGGTVVAVAVIGAKRWDS